MVRPPLLRNIRDFQVAFHPARHGTESKGQNYRKDEILNKPVHEKADS